MITAERKPFDEILELVEGKKKVLVAGCDTCVAICLTGGEKEAEILASELRLKAQTDGREVEVEHTAAIRQCEWEYLDLIAKKVEEADVVVSMACGIGIQSMAEKFAPKLVMPAVNTNMLGMPQEHAALARALRRLRRVRHRRDRRHLPCGALQQEPHERPLRRVARRQVRGDHAREGRHRLRLGPDLGPPQGAGPRGAHVQGEAAQELVEVQLGRPPQDGQGGGEAGMTDDGYKAGGNLEKILAAGKFAVTGECGPPKSADGSIIEKKAKILQGFVDAANITDNQTAVVRDQLHGLRLSGTAERCRGHHADDLPRPEPPGDAGRHPRAPPFWASRTSSASPATT